MTDITDERMATALERIADALERAHPKFHPGGYVGGDYTLPEIPLRGGERAVTREEIRARWKAALTAPQCTATMPGHWCARREHADDEHVWAVSDDEAERIEAENGETD